MRRMKTVLAGVVATFLMTIAIAPVMAPAFATHRCDDEYPPAPNCEVLGHQIPDDDDDDDDVGVGADAEGDVSALPFTGADLTLYVAGGLVLITGGALLVRRYRRSGEEA